MLYGSNFSVVQSIVVLMFFVPYVIFQPPMTIIIRKVGPTLFLGTIVITWAVIMIVWTPISSKEIYVDLV